MAMIETNNELPLGAITTHRIVAKLSETIAAVEGWIEARRTESVLRALSPEQLEDIGLTRADVETLAKSGRL